MLVIYLTTALIVFALPQIPPSGPDIGALPDTNGTDVSQLPGWNDTITDQDTATGISTASTSIGTDTILPGAKTSTDSAFPNGTTALPTNGTDTSLPTTNDTAITGQTGIGSGFPAGTTSDTSGLPSTTGSGGIFGLPSNNGTDSVTKPPVVVTSKSREPKPRHHPKTVKKLNKAKKRAKFLKGVWLLLKKYYD